MNAAAAWPELHAVLEQARELGFLGPAPVAHHIEHARGFVDVAGQALERPLTRWCDLGSGGGAPGLVLALTWPAGRGVLVESMQRRAQFLRDAVVRLSLSDRVEVAEGRAEALAHSPGVRETFPLVTARSFATPAVTAEIGAGFVKPTGILVVSEPPSAAAERWPAEGLAHLGFGAAEYRTGRDAHFAVLRKVRSAGNDVPRAVGRPTKRPRW